MRKQYGENSTKWNLLPLRQAQIGRLFLRYIDRNDELEKEVDSYALIYWLETK